MLMLDGVKLQLIYIEMFAQIVMKLATRNVHLKGEIQTFQITMN